MKKGILITLSLFVAGLSLMAQEAAVKKVEYPAGYESKIDVVYTKVKDWDGRLDVYFNPVSSTATPVVINIHGGGWNHGTKESQSGFNTFFKAGFAVANVEYRMVDEAKAPGAIEDIRSAMDYLILHAAELNIDPKRIVLMGGSAGAHLALMAGFLENDRRFDTYCKGKENMKVAAIISKYAPSDFVEKTDKFYTYKSLLNWMDDKAEDASFRASISPVTYINKNNPPVFIVHGNADPIVPYEQSVRLHQKLDQAGVYNEFITVEGGKHGNFEKDKNSEISKATMAFLKKVGVIQ
ncbi:MAG: alpha/beta hydrolase [Paludibacter sp.]|nr:alpha/beta hydrolase [Paludibacter sp.]